MDCFPVVILAGGLATRLYPLTQTLPKALIEVNGEPFITHQLRLLARAGVREVLLCLGYLGEQVTAAVGDGAAYGLKISTSFDGPRLLGTAGALRRALPLLPETFFVMYGDSYLECDYAAVQQAFIASGKPALMTVFRNEGRWDTSNVEMAEKQIVAYDKRQQTARMHHIDYGLGVFEREVFAALPPDEPADLAFVYQSLVKRGELAAYEVPTRFYEIGSAAGLAELRQHLMERGQNEL